MGLGPFHALNPSWLAHITFNQHYFNISNSIEVPYNHIDYIFNSCIRIIVYGLLLAIFFISFEYIKKSIMPSSLPLLLFIIIFLIKLINIPGRVLQHASCYTSVFRVATRHRVLVCQVTSFRRTSPPRTKVGVRVDKVWTCVTRDSGTRFIYGQGRC